MIVVFEMKVAVEVGTESAAKLTGAEQALKACMEEHFPQGIEDPSFVVRIRELVVRAPYREEVLALTPRKVHFRSGDDRESRIGICGNFASAKNLTELKQAVTCKLCLRLLAKENT
jgi:hypothetical protein